MPNESDPFKEEVWRMDNQTRTLIPGFKSLKADECAQGLEPGIYTLVGPNDSRCYLTLQPNGVAQLWDLNYDPDYLARSFKGLKYKGKKELPHVAVGLEQEKPSIESAQQPDKYDKGRVPEGTVCKHGNKDFCGFCYTGTEPTIK